jgi:hypothetical protein
VHIYKSAFKITTVAVELKSYSEIKDMNSIKSWVCDLGRGGGGVMVSKWGYSCLATLVFCGVTVNWLPGSAVMVSFWQMLRRGRSPAVVVELKVVLIVSSHWQHNYRYVFYRLKFHTFSLVKETTSPKFPFGNRLHLRASSKPSDILLCLMLVLNVVTVLLDAHQLLVPSVKTQGTEDKFVLLIDSLTLIVLIISH